MMLKRVFDPAALAAFHAARAMGETPPQPRITHVEVVHTGLTPEQTFDDGMIERAVAEGWASLSGDRLSLKTDGDPLLYTVKRAPGYFCKSTGEAIPMPERAWLKFRLGGDSTESQAAARGWLAGRGKEPNDYDIAVAYHCVLDADLHDKFRAVSGPKGQTVAAHTLEA